MPEVLVNDKIVSVLGTSADTKRNLTIPDPKDDVDGEQVLLALENTVNKNVLQDKDGNPITEVLSAKRVRITEEVLF